MNARTRIRVAAKRLFAGRLAAGENTLPIATTPAPGNEMSGGDVIAALLYAVDDQDLGHLEDLMVAAGVMWRCNLSERQREVMRRLAALWTAEMFDADDEDEATAGEPQTCILTGQDGENPDDCTTHEHDAPAATVR